MWMLNYKESWALKNWCFWTVVLEKTLKNALDYKQIKPVNPKGNQSWIFTGRTGTEAETPILWPSDVKNWLLEKSLMLGKIEGKREGDDRGWDGSMASVTRWTWVWASFGSWWWTGKPGVPQFMGSQRVRHDWLNCKLHHTLLLSFICLTPVGLHFFLAFLSFHLGSFSSCLKNPLQHFF